MTLLLIISYIYLVMKRKIITSYQHKTGIHCGSTSLSNILNYFGIALSEEMCFGLGSGIGFAYFSEINNALPIFVSGRTDRLETELLNNLGIENYLHSGDNFEETFDLIKEKIDNDEPVVVWVDTYYLPYFKTQYHFPMHRVIIVGYDEEKEQVYISDNEKEEIQIVSYENFKLARTSPFPPISTENKWYAITFNHRGRNIKSATKDALRKTADIMLQKENNNLGILGMRKLVYDLPKWRKILGDRWKLSAHIYYLFCEKFGTGGGNFRFIYSRFLEEIDIFPDVAKKYKEVAPGWQRASILIRDASKEDNFAKIITASDILNKVIQEEEDIYRKFQNL